ncbi:MAG: DUF2088 domain-containing protein [Planctomycetes bacterium]|nr:DUF2088 domain-containing protein [Planctomycetota bacterium]
MTESEKLPTLNNGQVYDWFETEVPAQEFAGKRVLLLVPDTTRTAPMPLLFDAIHRRLAPVVRKLDVMVALGTHPPMPESEICRMLGISLEDRSGRFQDVGLFNHEWQAADQLMRVGEFTEKDTREISNGLLSVHVPVLVNARVAEYDRLLVLGPVFPHEVVGFSGGNKYFFPGISGPDLLNFFHWLAALITNVEINGRKYTPVRNVVDRAAAMIPVERRCVAFVVALDGRLHGLFYGTPESAWSDAADLSARVHIKHVPRSFRLVVSCAPPMYDDLWVAGKCMYKLEPVVADGGELIIYAPHMKEISPTHGRVIEEIGYHVRDYFTKQWDRFRHYPWGVLAHSTHVKGLGTYEDGVEQPRIQVTLATGLPETVCRRINLGYRDPASLDIESYANREQEGVLLVRKAGEQLYRVRASRC